MKKEVRERLVHAFRQEALEVVDPLREEVDTLATVTGDDLERVVDECMRRLHNVKGSSTVVGLPDIAALAHALEDCMAAFRGRTGPVGDEAVGPVSDAVADLERMIRGEAATRDLAAWRVALGLEAMGGGAVAADVAASHATLGAPAGGGGRAARPGATRGNQRSPHERRSLASRARTVRIESGRIEELLSHSAELLAVRGRLASRSARLVQLLEDFSDTFRAIPTRDAARWGPLVTRMEELVQADRDEALALARVTSALQGSMHRLRLLPLAEAAPGWRSAVADTASRVGKSVRLEVDVGSIEIDKEVLDRLRDPLVHILRNAIDHGIESAEERRAAGKPARGSVRIAAAYEEGLIQLEVLDDGRGIRPDIIVAAAIRKGRIDPDAARELSDAEAIELLFAPGFSTRSEVSEVSGRGMGLHEVRRAVQELGGHLEVVVGDARRGGGFRLFFPVSMLTTRGLLVRSGGETYAIPVQAVERVLLGDAGELGRADGQSVIQLADGEPVRVRWLSELTGGRPPMPHGALKLVVLASHGVRWAMAVDEVLREDEFVIRRLPWNLRGVAGVGGVVPLHDGSVAIVLDVGWLTQRATSAAELPAGEAGAEGRDRPLRALVVDDSLSVRNLHASLLRSAGYEVETAVDGRHAWDTLCRSSFDVVVSDVDMPGLDGFELTERVRREATFSAIPVVLVTSAEDTASEVRAREVGADAYLRKGKFERRRLLEAAALALGRRGRS